MERNYILGVPMLLLSGVLFVFKETIATAIGGLLSKILHPSVFGGGSLVSFSGIDVLIMALLVGAVLAFFWPIISRFLESEVSRNSFKSSRTQKKIYVDLQFTEQMKKSVFNDAFKPVFIDCTFNFDAMAILDYSTGALSETISMECGKIVICTKEDMDRLGKNVRYVKRPHFMNCQIFVETLYLSEKQFNSDPNSKKKSKEMIVKYGDHVAKS
jgi:hypothetical protein